MKKYQASVGINIHYDIGLDGDDYIYAENESEAEEIAKMRAVEDVDINGATFCEADVTVYYVDEVDEVAGEDITMGASFILNRVLSKGKSEQSNAEVLALICGGAVNCGENVKFDWNTFFKELRIHRKRGRINDEKDEN